MSDNWGDALHAFALKLFNLRTLTSQERTFAFKCNCFNWRNKTRWESDCGGHMTFCVQMTSVASWSSIRKTSGYSGREQQKMSLTPFSTASLFSPKHKHAQDILIYSTFRPQTQGLIFHTKRETTALVTALLQFYRKSSSQNISHIFTLTCCAALQKSFVCFLLNLDHFSKHRKKQTNKKN